MKYLEILRLTERYTAKVVKSGPPRNRGRGGGVLCGGTAVFPYNF